MLHDGAAHLVAVDGGGIREAKQGVVGEHRLWSTGEEGWNSNFTTLKYKYRVHAPCSIQSFRFSHSQLKCEKPRCVELCGGNDFHPTHYIIQMFLDRGNGAPSNPSFSRGRGPPGTCWKSSGGRARCQPAGRGDDPRKELGPQ